MKFHHVLRLGIAAALFASLAACTVVPTQPRGYYGGPPVVVETYPVYRYEAPHRHYYYERHDHRGYDDRDGRHYRDSGRRHESPLEGAARSHREIRRSLGLPRLPGMP